MRRRLIYAVFVLILLATAGPLLALALGEGMRVLEPLIGSPLVAGLVIVFNILLVLTVVGRSHTMSKWRRRRRTAGQVPLFPRDAPRDDIGLEISLATHPQPERQPKDFIHRLAGYLHRDPEELAGPSPYAESKMSFWSRVGRLRWMGPKPAYLIRRLLERIREQVRGRSH